MAHLEVEPKPPRPWWPWLLVILAILIILIWLYKVYQRDSKSHLEVGRQEKKLSEPIYVLRKQTQLTLVNNYGKGKYIQELT